jgi:flagellar hook-length control protein FliK
MVQSATSAGTGAAEGHKALMSTPAPDSDFTAVLKSVAEKSTISSGSSRTSGADHTDRVADTAKLSNDKATSGATSETSESRNDQDTTAALSQIIDRMAAVVQQMLNNPQPKDASALLETLFGQGADSPAVNQDSGLRLPGSGADLSALISGNNPQLQTTATGADLAPLVDNNGAMLSQVGESQSPNGRFSLFAMQNNGEQGNNPVGLLGQLTANAATAAGKTGDMNNGADMLKDDNANEAYQLPQDSGALELMNKTRALLSQSVSTFDEALAEFKTGALTGRAGDMKDSGSAAGFYSHSLQAQDASVRSAQHIQETIPSNRISAVDQVISKAINAGQQDIVIRIDPPDLGSIHIRLSLDNGVLKADVRVDSAAVKDSFLAAMPQIKTALENSGVKASVFNVDVRDDQDRSGQSGNNNAKQQQRQDGEAKNAFSDFFA